YADKNPTRRALAPFQFEQDLSGCRVDYLRRPVIKAGDKALAVRAERQAAVAVHRLIRAGHERSRAGVPHAPTMLIAAAGDDPGTVRAERQARAVRFPFAHGLPRPGIPHDHEAAHITPTESGYLRAIGAEGGAQHSPWGLAQLELERSR